MNIRHSVLLAVLSLAVALPSAAFAQGKGTLRFLVGVQAGASLDTIARLLAEKLRVSLDENVVVENRPGAAQRIALGELKKSAPDGHTIMITASAAFSILPHIYGDKTGYDALKDFAPITRVVKFQVGLATGPMTGAKNLKEFIAWAKAHPDKASYGTPGAGTSSHFVGIMLSKAIGVNMTHVPYKGGAPALTDLIAGHIPLVSTAFSDLPTYHKAGQIIIIATAGPERNPAVPDVPTLKENGIDISFDVGFDIHTVAGTPPDVVKQLNTAIVAAIKSPDVSAKLNGMGLQPAGISVEEFTAKQAEEYKLWAEPVKESGFKGE